MDDMNPDSVRRRSIPVAVFLGLLLLTACEGGGRSQPSGVRQASPSPFENERGCPRDDNFSSLPGEAGCISLTSGDADGDGTSESLVVYANVGANRFPQEWFIRLERPEGSVVDQVDLGRMSDYPRAVGAADIEGDGADEWFVATHNLAGHGTFWQGLSLYVVENDKLEIVTVEKEPLVLLIGGVSRAGEGLACRGGRLQLLRAEAQNVRNTRWDTSTRVLSIDGTRARLVSRRTGRLSLSHYTDPDLDPFFHLECGDLYYPP